MMGRFRIVSIALVIAVAAGIPARADDNASLRTVRGTVGYQVAKDAPFARVFGSYLIQDNYFAVTQRASNALLALHDSSEVALGENTTIQVGAITQAAATTPTAVTLVAGTIRFAVRHPAGQQANYRFATTTSQIAVRGTVGLYSTGPNGDVVSCLDCAAGDVTVTAGGQSIPLLTGQSAFISLAGVVTVAATTAVVASAFSSAGLSTTTTSASSFAPGVSTAGAAGGAGGAAGAGIGTTTAIVGGAVAATAIGVTAAANHASPAPAQTTSPSGASATPTPAPTATPTQAGAIDISGNGRAPAPTAPTAATMPPAPVVPPAPAGPPPPPPAGTMPATEHRPR